MISQTCYLFWDTQYNVSNKIEKGHLPDQVKEEIPRVIGTTRELWSRSKTKSLEMMSELGIPMSVTSNLEAGELALNMDIQACSGRT